MVTQRPSLHDDYIQEQIEGEMRQREGGSERKEEGRERERSRCNMQGSDTGFLYLLRYTRYGEIHPQMTHSVLKVATIIIYTINLH